MALEGDGGARTVPVSASSSLHRELGAGKMAMMALGGAIGTGLFLGSGAALPVAGPAVVFSYAVGAAITFAVAMALGEMAVRHPEAGSFGVAADIYLGDWAGFLTRYAYWTCMLLSLGADLVACATYMRYWAPGVAPAWWVVLFTVALVIANLISVGKLGALEYWLATVKVCTILAFIAIAAALLLSRHVPAQYLSTGRFVPHGGAGIVLAVPFALFSFLGAEFVAVSAGEARGPAEIRRATLWTFGLLSFLYIGAMAALAGLVPSNQLSTAESPFVTVFRHAGVPFAGGLVDVVVLTAALSGSNASLYIASRMLYSLGKAGDAPAATARTNARGVPVVAVLASALGAVAAILVQIGFPQSAYLFITGVGLFGGMLTWIFGLTAHIALRRKVSAGKLDQSAFRAPGGAVTSAMALTAIVAILAGTWFLPQFRITVESGLPYLAVLTLLYLLIRGTGRGRPDRMVNKALATGSDESR